MCLPLELNNEVIEAMLDYRYYDRKFGFDHPTKQIAIFFYSQAEEEIIEWARRGSVEASSYLKANYNLKVFTYKEIEEVENGSN